MTHDALDQPNPKNNQCLFHELWTATPIFSRVINNVQYFTSKVSQSASQMAHLFTSHQLKADFLFPCLYQTTAQSLEACVPTLLQTSYLFPNFNIKRSDLDYNKHFQLHFGVVGLVMWHIHKALAAEFLLITGTNVSPYWTKEHCVCQNSIRMPHDNKKIIFIQCFPYTCQ